MTLTRVLITVKTYPTISSKYDELVCTAGFKEDGTWIRIYPVPFRQRAYSEQYKKYDWIELALVKNTSDFRPESYRPATLETEIKVVGHVDTARNWQERKGVCLGKVYYNLSELIAEAKNKNIGTSLAVFKPTEILDFYAEPVEREWSSKQKANLAQQNLFETKFEVVKKLPYKFKFRFKDDQGKVSNMMIEDWETGQLFWRQYAKYEGNEKKAIDDVRKKYFDDFSMTKDLHFYLGTTQKNHYVSHNPFMIIGTFHPKIETQMKMF
ncbi:hypothetical protein [Cyclobacterium marinum]|uniref:hypothetical protein n=1 Tax=Cyclobacterium marinum TaxID=104 RepID=UPI0011EEA4B1|nr:hypothetical protein [Cyclobacterium marinum]MBI0400405.1 hypothetical protein [Cyclobacterium marinum]